MCLRYPQASSVATLPTGSILPSPSPLPHGCILSPTWLYTTLRPKNKKKKTKKTWLTNFFDSTVSVYFRNLLTLIMSVEQRTMAVF